MVMSSQRTIDCPHSCQESPMMRILSLLPRLPRALKVFLNLLSFLRHEYRIQCAVPQRNARPLLPRRIRLSRSAPFPPKRQTHLPSLLSDTRRPDRRVVPDTRGGASPSAPLLQLPLQILVAPPASPTRTLTHRLHLPSLGRIPIRRHRRS